MNNPLCTYELRRRAKHICGRKLLSYRHHSQLLQHLGKISKVSLLSHFV